MSTRQNLYVGRAGQMAVMAEFLWRGWNVALPEVDVGEDVFVVKDDSGDLWRIQVKTATARPQGKGYSATFRVALKQLRTPRTPDLVYVFAIRGLSSWEPFIIIGRDSLLEEHELRHVGSKSRGSVIFQFVLSEPTLTCSRQDLTAYRNDWSRWPILAH
jgi:hypothetical protein